MKKRGTKGYKEKWKYRKCRIIIAFFFLPEWILFGRYRIKVTSPTPFTRPTKNCTTDVHRKKEQNLVHRSKTQPEVRTGCKEQHWRKRGIVHKKEEHIFCIVCGLFVEKMAHVGARGTERNLMQPCTAVLCLHFCFRCIVYDDTLHPLRCRRATRVKKMPPFSVPDRRLFFFFILGFCYFRCMSFGYLYIYFFVYYGFVLTYFWTDNFSFEQSQMVTSVVLKLSCGGGWMWRIEGLETKRYHLGSVM